MRTNRSLALCAGMAVMAVLSPHAADAASPHLGRHATNPTSPMGAPEDLGSNVTSMGNGINDTGGGSSPTDLATTAADVGHVTGGTKLDHMTTSIAGASADNLHGSGDDAHLGRG